MAHTPKKKLLPENIENQSDWSLDRSPAPYSLSPAGPRLLSPHWAPAFACTTMLRRVRGRDKHATAACHVQWQVSNLPLLKHVMLR